jgi:hypothetical protein|tara:strand:+ start:827 stop:1279 length:453 start_codon:yes stop_codon:yes gene_type:complete
MTDKTNKTFKDWNYGLFGIRHDGENWNLIRLSNPDEILATNKSSVPLANAGRALNRKEKADIKLEKLQDQARDLAVALDKAAARQENLRALAHVACAAIAPEPEAEEAPVEPDFDTDGKTVKQLRDEATRRGHQLRARELRGDLITILAA